MDRLARQQDRYDLERRADRRSAISGRRSRRSRPESVTPGIIPFRSFPVQGVTDQRGGLLQPQRRGVTLKISGTQSQPLLAHLRLSEGGRTQAGFFGLAKPCYCNDKPCAVISIFLSGRLAIPPHIRGDRGNVAVSHRPTRSALPLLYARPGRWPTMNLGKLLVYFETSPALRLLRSPNAAFIVDFSWISSSRGLDESRSPSLTSTPR